MKIYIAQYNDILDKKRIDELNSLGYKAVIRDGTGYDNIDVPYLLKKGMDFEHLDGSYCAKSVAERALWFALSFCKQHKLQLSGKKVMVLGARGRIGGVILKRLIHMGCIIRDHDLAEYDFNEEAYWQNVKKDLPDVEFIFLQVPLNEKTKNYFKEEHYKLMHRQPFIINTSRLGLLDLNLIENALRQNWIRGYACDDIPNTEHLYLKGCIFTEHDAAKTDEAEENRKMAVEKHTIKYSDH